MAEPRKISLGRRGKSYDEIRRQAVRLTSALGAELRGNAPEPYPNETNFWAGMSTARGRAIARVAGRYLENIRDENGLPVDYGMNDRRAYKRYNRRVYARRNANWE